VIFVTNNEGKHREVVRLLAGLDVHFKRLDLARPEGLEDTADLARARATEAYARLGEPCFCESTGLFLQEQGGAPGTKTKRALRELGEAGFASTYGGSHGLSRVAVAYADGPSVRVFTGSISGTVLSEPRGYGGYGWDRLWLPDGFERTLAEMRESSYVVNMRAAPYLELYDHLRGATAEGTFEAHVTVAPCSLDAFRAACAELGVKCIAIELPDGETRQQPMTASFHRGEQRDVEREVMAVARDLARRGFDPTRTKIERHGRLEGTTPETDEEARRAPATSYFEYHVKLALDPAVTAADLAAIAAAVRPFGAHLSRNARATGARFVTLRAGGVGRKTAESRFADLLAEIARCGLTVTNRVREYTVFDTNVGLDRGWLS
jgi:non-canonical purine NTP pyrophosphatase (RdgB/HAM1 family)